MSKEMVEKKRYFDVQVLAADLKRSYNTVGCAAGGEILLAAPVFLLLAVSCWLGSICW